MGQESSLQRMVQLLKVSEYVKDPRVEAVLLKVDRSHYCPSIYPYHDSPCSLGYGATISAPHMHAFALESLKDKLTEGAKALDVGSGSGYLTACMAHMVGSSGTVYGVEHIRQLVKQSQENIGKDCPELLDSGRVKIFVSDGREGLPDYAPFDVIHVGATAPNYPKKLIEQLKNGGLMVLPVERDGSQFFEKIEKLPGQEIRCTPLLQVRYVPLTDVATQLGQNRG